MRSVPRAKSDHARATIAGAGVFASAVPAGRIGAAVDKDWLAVLGRLLAGDRVAFLEVNRLVTGFLVQLRAYDFRDEWDDLRQEVLLSVVANARAGRLRDPKAFVGYVRIITRNKFIDRLKARLRHHEKEALPWDEETARAMGASADRDGRAREHWSAVRDLPAEELLLRFETERDRQPAAERRAVEEHLARCPSCKDELAALRRFDLASVEPRAAASLAASFAALLRRLVLHPAFAYAIALLLLYPALEGRLPSLARQAAREDGKPAIEPLADKNA